MNGRAGQAEWDTGELAKSEAMLRAVFADALPVVADARDWSDVRRRAGRRRAAPAYARRPRRVAVLIAAGLGVLALGGLASAGQVLSLLGVRSSAPSAPAIAPGVAPYIVGDELFGIGTASVVLARPVADQYWDTAVLSSDGSTLVYESAVSGRRQQEAGSAFRWRDLATASDQELEPETYAPVSSADGRLAYGRTVPHSGGGDVGAVFPSRIEVRSSLHSPPAIWTADAAAYLPVAWAGTELLVERVGDNASKTLWAYTGPEEARSLGAGWLIAVSPDGTRALIGEGSRYGGGSPASGLRIVDVTTGATVVALDLAASTPGQMPWQSAAPTGPGDWRGDTIIMPAPLGVVRLRLRGSDLSLASLDKLQITQSLAGAEFHEARFAANGDQTALILANVIPAGGGQTMPAALSCDLAQRICDLSGSETGARRPFSLITEAGTSG
jgi:hypothetical protein